MRFVLKASAAVILLVVAMAARADAQTDCRKQKTVEDCMKCVQKRGDAGSSGGRNFCSRLVAPWTAEERKARATAKEKK